MFIIHIEVVTRDGNVHRISISNMFNPEAVKVGMGEGAGGGAAQREV